MGCREARTRQRKKNDDSQPRFKSASSWIVAHRARVSACSFIERNDRPLQRHRQTQSSAVVSGDPGRKEKSKKTLRELKVGLFFAVLLHARRKVVKPSDALSRSASGEGPPLLPLPHAVRVICPDNVVFRESPSRPATPRDFGSSVSASDSNKSREKGRTKFVRLTRFRGSRSINTLRG